ncbi:MAG: hypothetical protein QXL16_02320, partial [Candidatus Micrarchaeaceae archaeon]
FVPLPMVRELKNIAKSKGKKGMQAKYALKILKNFELLRGSGEADLFLLKMCSKYTVITNDKSLRRKIKEKGCNAATISKSKKIVFA